MNNKPKIIALISFVIVLFYMMGHVSTLTALEILGISLIITIVVYYVSNYFFSKQPSKLKKKN